MENRQRMEQHIVGRKAPRIAQREGIGGEIAVAEHRSLRPARRSRCIKDRRNIPLVPGDRLERRRSLSRLFGKGAATQCVERLDLSLPRDIRQRGDHVQVGRIADDQCRLRSEEHTSELQSLMRISYAVFCLKKKKTQTTKSEHPQYKNTTID